LIYCKVKYITAQHPTNSIWYEHGFTRSWKVFWKLSINTHLPDKLVNQVLIMQF